MHYQARQLDGQCDYLSASNMKLPVWPPNTEQFNNTKFICWGSHMHYVTSQWYLPWVTAFMKNGQGCKKPVLQAGFLHFFHWSSPFATRLQLWIKSLLVLSSIFFIGPYAPSCCRNLTLWRWPHYWKTYYFNTD